MLKIIDRLRVTINSIDLNYEKEFMGGKSDPFVQFKYKDKIFKTSVKDGGGTKAVWDEEFMLEKIGFVLDNHLVFEIYDTEMIGTRALGNTSKTLTIKDYVRNYAKDFVPRQCKLDIVDKNMVR